MHRALSSARRACRQRDQTTVIARVNGTPITDAMVKEVVKSLIVARRPTAPSSDEIAQLSDAALDSLIDLELLYQARAGGAGPRQRPRTCRREIATLQGARRRRQGFRRRAAAQRPTEAQLAAETRKTMMVDRLVEQRLMKDVRVTPEAARRFYDEHQSEFQRGGKLIPFDQAKPAVEQTLLESERRQRQQAYLAELRKNARIEHPTPVADKEQKVVPTDQ